MFVRKSLSRSLSVSTICLLTTSLCHAALAKNTELIAPPAKKPLMPLL